VEPRARFRTGVVFGVLASLPFLETLLYAAHVGPGKAVLSTRDYLEIGSLSVVLLALMIATFLTEQADIHAQLSHWKDDLDRMLRSPRLKRRALFGLAGSLFIFLILLAFGGEKLGFLRNLLTLLGPLVSPALQLIGAMIVTWIIARLLESLSKNWRASLREGIASWAFSLRLSVFFYMLLIAGTWKFLSLDGIKDGCKLEVSLGLAKDYLLLFLIANMLYVGLFKIAVADSLRDVFQSRKGFHHFFVICGIIAVLAVWADFGALNPVRQNECYHQDWQKQYNRLHVYLRDIVLLLLPIAGLLFWTLFRVGREIDTTKRVA